MLKKKKVEFVFCYWDEPKFKENDSSSLQKKQNSKKDVHESLSKRANTGSNN